MACFLFFLIIYDNRFRFPHWSALTSLQPEFLPSKHGVAASEQRTASGGRWGAPASKNDGSSSFFVKKHAFNSQLSTHLIIILHNYIP